MFTLVTPSTSFYESFIESHREWNGAHQDGAGVHMAGDITSPEGFADWVQQLVDAESAPEKDGIVPCTYLWITEGTKYVGAIAFRHSLTPYLLSTGGHIGYGVRPSERGRGAASWALNEMCSRLAASSSPDRVLVTCEDANVASAKTIERCGGVLEDLRVAEDGRKIRRYWIDVSADNG
ncbi:putative acetyltransferase [Paenarthrobacter nitroguajacolicus]|uniref:GNAT family N-acetyltransferase n=1 Tax=Paenarthrobacter nitroguajacolicus TaxID=211146 RepID=UPI0028584600|nr:GNAT family N-acetyltransferase [Paenarthrobacter nitroguajacolicus]MDR6988458.1 putative acetyltransferase [Paenarthrobacter nitroguajacolicus]